MQNQPYEVESFNRLLRGELSAVETYQQAMERIRTPIVHRHLQRIVEDHQQAVGILRDHIQRLGGAPDQSSGAWGAWAKVVEGTASIFGEAAALKALKEGEEHGLKEYDIILNEPGFPNQFRSLLNNHLKLRQSEHITTLDRCLDSLH